MSKITLLPRKEFELNLSSGVVAGKFGTWATNRFCTLRGWTLNQYGEHFKIEVDEKGNVVKSNVSTDDIADTILCAVEYSARLYKKQFNISQVQVYNWIDEELGGFYSEDIAKLFEHISSEDGEKKSQEDDSLNGENSRKSTVQPA